MPTAPRTLRGLGLTVLAPLVGCAVSEPGIEVDVRPQVEVATFDAAGMPTSGRDLAEEVYGLGPNGGPRVGWERVRAVLGDTAVDEASAARRSPDRDRQQDPQQDPAATAAAGEEATAGGGAEQDPQDPVEIAAAQAEAEAKRRSDEARLRIAFGDAILINPDGTVTKQYFLGSSAGQVFLNLLAPLSTAKPNPSVTGQRFGGPTENAQGSVLGRMLGPDNEVEIVYFNDFETLEDMPPRANAANQTKPTKGGSNSLLLVTAEPSALTAFERALDLFYSNIPQVQIEVKVVEYTESDTLAFGITPIDGNTPTFSNLRSGRLINSITSDFPLTAPLTGGGSITDRGLISLGGIHDSWELNAVLEALATRNVADIKSQPTLVVRNGGLATVTTVTEQPFPEARISNQTVATTNIKFKNVGIVMDIRPEVAGTNTVVLNIYVSVSAITGFVQSEPVPTPIVATREAATSVHLREGQATVIGGLVSDSSLDTETKVPLLGDIPLLGMLFRSTSTQRQRTMLEFYITPRILVGPRSGGGF